MGIRFNLCSCNFLITPHNCVTCSISFCMGAPYMLPLATVGRIRIWSFTDYWVRALLSICGYICDLWEHHFALGQHNEQEPAWREQRVGCCGGWAGWSWNTFMEGIAKLSLFYSHLPAMTKGWGKIMEWKKKNKQSKSCFWKKEYVWNRRAKSPIKFTTELFIWILIVVVGSSLWLSHMQWKLFAECPQMCSE